MASIRKTKSNTWLAEVRRLGQYKSKTFPTKLQAQAWAVEMEQIQSPDILVKGKTLADAFKRYQKEVSPKKDGHKFEHNRLNKYCREEFASIRLTDIQQATFNMWIDKELERIKSSSVNRDLNLLSAVFEKAKIWQWCETNPIKGIKRPKDPPSRTRRISKNEEERILKALNYTGEIEEQRHEIAVAFLLALETAMRQGEIWGLRWEFIFLEERYIALPKTKNGDARDVPLSKEAIKLLKKFKSETMGKVFKTKQASSATIFRSALLLAGIEGMVFHDTRHESLTRLARKLDMLDLARMVGHRDPRSLMVYYNPTAQEMASRLD